MAKTSNSDKAKILIVDDVSVNLLLVRFLPILLAFCICASACAQQAEPAGTTPLANAPLVPAAGNNVSLSPDERQWLLQHGRIRIGVTVIPPQVLRNDGKYKGLAIDYIQLMERKLGRRFDLVPYATWNEVIEAAKTRQIDMIFAAQQTAERLTYLRFTQPYIELANMILVRKDRQGGSSLNDMKGWSVAVSEGSAVHEYLKKESGYLELRPVHDELSGLMKVSMGEADAMVVEVSRASYYIEEAGILNLRIAGNAGLLYKMRFAVRNDWPVLSEILDKGLSSITDEKKREISQRWIIVGDRSIFASRTFWILFFAGLGVITLTVVGAIVWNRTLRRIVRQRTAQLQQELTKREKAEATLLAKNEELKAITQQLWQAAKLATMGELASSIAHELNNPLATVSLRVESLIAKTTGDDPRRRELEIIGQEVERMGNLVRNLLQFSHRSQQQISTVNVCDEIEKTLELVHYHLRKNNVAVAREFKTEGPLIHADRQQLRQLFLNLFTNAGDAMPEGGTLTIRVAAQPEGKKIFIEIADTGIGIPPEILPKVMEHFYTTKSEGKGTGLGLAICQRIAQEHQGTFDIVSEGIPGKGTKVRITLSSMDTGNSIGLTDP